MNSKGFQRPLLACGTAAYLLYCIAGLAAAFLVKGGPQGDPGVKSKMLLMALEVWPYPMLQGLGWRANPESPISWLAADGAGLLLVILVTLTLEWILGPERRMDANWIPVLLIGLGVLLLITEFTVVAVIRITESGS